MEITKLEHSCLMIEESSRRCYVDPGKFTTPIADAAKVDAVVITHEHDDHWTPEQLGRIASRSPGLQVVTTAATADAIAKADIPNLGNVIVGKPGARYVVGAFEIQCYGGTHAEIHRSIPLIDNLGVVINGEFAYGGDSYELPPTDPAVKVLAVPVYGPWMRIAESIDLIEQVRPKYVIGVHEMLLARPGKELAAERLADAALAVGGEFLTLDPYDTFEFEDSDPV